MSDATGESGQRGYTISILVPATSATAVTTRREGDAVDNHGLRDVIPWGHAADVDVREVQDQWKETLDALLMLIESAGQFSKGWYFEEITFGMTLSAKGKLLFIAEAGVSGSVTVKLKRTPAPPSAAQAST